MLGLVSGCIAVDVFAVVKSLLCGNPIFLQRSAFHQTTEADGVSDTETARCVYDCCCGVRCTLRLWYWKCALDGLLMYHLRGWHRVREGVSGDREKT